MQRYEVCVLMCVFVSDGGCVGCEVNVDSHGGEYVNTRCDQKVPRLGE